MSTTQLEAGAEFSPCRQWRYSLWRHWDWKGFANVVMFIGLNPSTADETANDPTVTRCINFAKAWGFGGMYMMNAYAFRATDPKVMKAATEPVGCDNDEQLAYYATRAGLIIAAWGNHITDDRQMRLRSVLNGYQVKCLGKTLKGRPKHPLYLKAETKPELFWEGGE